ncbi:hypothetical protein [Reticulibacter mediterranei]|uniref:hypothetical protein n=1 Tax=Reticulibacter mediterranei TaxID=2778369 RepID=UPI001C68C568|nr:hypothetical protein [Reticulibacter mediterranei]
MMEGKNTQHYLVLQVCRDDPWRRPPFTLVAGPFESDQALAEQKRLWEQEGRWAVLQEIGNAFYLPFAPPLPACTCSEQHPDPACLFGPYLFKRATDLEALVQHQGFLSLSADLQDQVQRQQDGWLKKYRQHVLLQNEITTRPTRKKL